MPQKKLMQNVTLYYILIIYLKKKTNANVNVFKKEKIHSISYPV